MITRVLEARLRTLARKFPVVTVTGPRQSGKTTLCRAAFAQKPYVSLERFTAGYGGAPSAPVVSWSELDKRQWWERAELP